MAMQTIEVARDIASAIARGVEDLGRDVIYIASTDWTHYEPHEISVKKDLGVLEYVKKLDVEGFYRYIVENNVSACGPGPTMVFIYLAKIWGYREARILKYAASGDVTGERSWVVGYASSRRFDDPLGSIVWRLDVTKYADNMPLGSNPMQE
jgi:AmmeMemoRadiSam system protein B